MKYTNGGSVEISPPAREGESGIRRNALTKDALVTRPLEGIETVTDVLLYNARTHGTRNGYGWRDIVESHVEEKEIKKTIEGVVHTEKKKWTYFQLSEYKWMTYVDFKNKALDISKGLVELGIQQGQIFNIYAETHVSWQLVQHACAAISVPIATAYATLGESGLTHSLNEPECVGVFTNADLLPTLAKVLANTPTIRFVIYDGSPTPELLGKLTADNADRKVLSLDELEALGKGKPDTPERRPKSTDLACIMYTSGTTGAPKGVILTHAMLIGAVGTVKVLLGHLFQPETDSFLAFLPLAHIMEYVVELSLSFVGCPIGYGRVRTLTDASVRHCQGDIKEFAPTIMIGVPQIWETIRKGILAKVDKMSSIKKSVFNGSILIKKAQVPFLSQVVDSVVLSQVKAQTGGRLRYVLSGGAALSTETQEFLNAALVTVLQGYGLTETCGMCAILPPELWSLGPAGVPAPSVEIKFLDVPEAGYSTKGELPQGEILIRGTSVTKGYFKRPDLNEDRTIFTEDGWFRTGDVGQWNKDGTLSIIDRIKNLVKLAGGEYIALERLETAYRTSGLVGNLCIHATAESNQPIAIVFPHEANLRDRLTSLIASGNTALPPANSDIHLLSEHKAVQDLVLADLLAVAKKNGLKKIETVQGVVLTPEEWTPQSGLLTAAQKVQRKAVEKAFHDQIKACYKASQASD